jgi:hypothetical protein
VSGVCSLLFAVCSLRFFESTCTPCKHSIPQIFQRGRVMSCFYTLVTLLLHRYHTVVTMLMCTTMLRLQDLSKDGPSLIRYTHSPTHVHTYVRLLAGIRHFKHAPSHPPPLPLPLPHFSHPNFCSFPSYTCAMMTRNY